ncbi:SMP-30/gluconolactonase/LRE family protein [Nonomuraea sp. NPDC003201]
MTKKDAVMMSGTRALLTGRGLVESPRWHGDRLYFSDWSAGEVIAVDLGGHSEVVAHVASLPLCTAWSPEGRLLIVSSRDGRLLRLEPDGSVVTHADLGQTGWNDIAADGSLSGLRVWAELGEGTPDGICVDEENAVWYPDVPNRRCVRVAEGGKALQTVELDRGGFACAPDGRTLFVVAAEWQGMTSSDLVVPGSGQVLTVEVEVPGAGRP